MLIGEEDLKDIIQPNVVAAPDCAAEGRPANRMGPLPHVHPKAV